MKFIRLLLFCVVGLAVLLAVVVALAFHSGVQTWAARRAIATQPDLNLAIGTVNAGLNVTRVESIHLIQPGLDLVVPAAEVEVSLTDAASSRVAVKRVVAKGWTLDLSQPVTISGGAPAKQTSAAPAQPSPLPAEVVSQAFAGIFQQLRLPADFSLDGLDIEGDVILPAGQGTVHVVITGGNIGVGQDGKVVFKAVLVSAKKGAQVGSMVLQSDITVRMDTPRSFEHLAVTTNATATGEQFPKGADVHVLMDAVRGAKGDEAYSVVLRAGQKELVNFAAKLPEGAESLTGTWVLDVQDADLAPFTLGRALPAFMAAGKGTIIVDREFSEIHAVGNLNTTIDRLAALSPEFSAIGKIDFTADFDVTRQGDFIRFDRFSAQLSGAKPVVSIETRQIMKFNSVTHALEAAQPADDLFIISVQGLPLAWTRPFLPGFDVTGDDVKGEFAAGTRDGGFAIHPLTPLTLGQLNVSQGGKPLVRALDLSLSVGADYTPKGWQAELSNLSVVSGVSTLIKLSGKAGQLAGDNQPIKATVTFETDLPALLGQPGAPVGLALSDGVARGDITASLTDKQEIAVTLQLANLVGKNHQPMPAVALYVRADRAANGRIDAQAPLVITHAGRKSDLTLGAVVQSLKTGMQIDAQLKSDALYIEDLKLFAGLVPPATPVALQPQPAVKPPTPASVPSGPLWAGVSGELKLELRKVVYSSAFQVTDIGGAIKITPEAVSLDTLRAALGGEASLKAGGSLSYDAKKAAEPYGLKADLAVTNFDPAPMLRALDPLKPVQVEGKFDLSTRLAGRALDPAEFKDTALGDVSLISRGGTLRVLGVKAGNTANNVSKAAVVVGLFGALTGNSTASKYAGRGQAGADAVKQLGTIKFDQLNVVVERDAQRNVVMKEISLISPGVRLAGSGKIAYMPGVPLVQQPLAINLQLGARDRLAANLRTLRLLGAGAGDELGYLPLVEPIKLDGTLQSIGTSQLQHLIDRAIAD
ncbi:MAG: hypothetical protein WC661_11300 [Opitutaceae bacterium]|jgi:hypothetical protein